MIKTCFSLTVDENSSSNSGSSKMDEETTKASEENCETPSPDTVIGTFDLRHQKCISCKSLLLINTGQQYMKVYV